MKHKSKLPKCPHCEIILNRIEVDVEGAQSKAISYQCPKCEYFEFDKESSAKVVAELKRKESPLLIEQNIIKLSHDRLGMYFNKNIVKSLDLRPGEKISVSIPDKKHIILNLDKKRK